MCWKRRADMVFVKQAFGTNIGATILLSRVLQQWSQNTPDVSNRILYGSIFTLALGSNYGAFSYTYVLALIGNHHFH